MLGRDGNKTNGPYDHVRFAGIDVDHKDDLDLALKEAKAVRDAFKAVGITAYIERSKGKGYHVFAFLDAPTKAAFVRKLCRQVVVNAGLSKDPEIFPKQDSAAEDKVGNLINLPYFGNSRWIWGPDSDPAVDAPWPLADFLNNVVRHSGQDLQLAMDAASSHSPTAAAATSAPTTPPAVRKLSSLLAPQTQGSRNQTMFDLAQGLCRSRIDQAAATIICKRANQDYSPPLPDDEVIQTVNSAYSYSITPPAASPPAAMSATNFVATHAGRTIKFFVEPVLREKGSCVLFGATGLGKSSVAFQVAWELALGTQQLGLPYQNTPIRTLILDGENGVEVLTDRITQFRQLDPGTNAADNIFVCVDDGYFSFGGPHAQPDKLEWLTQTISDNDIQLVIVDALQNFCRAPENVADEMRPALDSLKRACTAGNAAVMLIHHINKSKDHTGLYAMRGSTTISDWAESLIGITTDSGDTLKLTFEKTRLGYRPEPLMLKRTLMDIRFSPTAIRGRRSCTSSDVLNAYQTVAAAQNSNSVAQKLVVAELAKICNVSPETAGREIRRAAKAKVIKRKGPRNKLVIYV